MTIGDIVSRRPVERVVRVERFLGAASAWPLAAELIDAEIFEPLANAKPPSTPGTLRRLFARWLGSPVRASSRTSILRLLSDYPDVGLQQTVLGIEEIEVPFPHILLLSGKDLHDYRIAAESESRSALQTRWGNYVDPLTGLRIRILKSGELTEDQLVCFFGQGIFAPRVGETSIERVEIVLGDRAVEPLLPGGMSGGFYRGQSALVFSASRLLTPAALADFPHMRGTLLLRPADAESLCAFELVWQASEDELHIRYPMIDLVDPPPDGVSAAFSVRFAGAPQFQVHVREHTRLSLLRGAPPPGEPAFKIVGVLQPEIAGRPMLECWWIDLDVCGRLVASAARRPRRSLICSAKGLRTWDWLDVSNRAAYPARLGVCRVGDVNRNVIWAPHHAPFGWLAAPAATQAVSYLPSDLPDYGLDWLDFAGAARDASEQTERLATLLSRSNLPSYIPGTSGGGPAGVIPVASGPEGRFAPAWDRRWKPGLQVVCEPFILEMSGPG